MAYNSSYNPDALPAHAEPEQAAQLLGPGGQPRPNSDPRRQRSPSNTGRPSPHPNPDPRRQRSPSNTGRPSPHPTPPQQHGGGRPAPPPKDSGPPNSGRVSSGQGGPPPSSDPKNRLYSPPPPNYGLGPRPAAQNRPPPSSRPPRSPQPTGMPRSDEPNDLFPLFRAANASNTGTLSESELGSALVNGDYTSFDPDTVKMMIRMFDKDGNGRVGFDEFVALWRFLAAWRELFDRFDEDHSSRISFSEFANALIAFGYRLSQPFVRMVFVTFERKGLARASHIPTQKDGLSFDLFVQACITLKRMTDVFKKYDDDRDGYITVSFEEFLTEVLRLRE